MHSLYIVQYSQPINSITINHIIFLTGAALLSPLPAVSWISTVLLMPSFECFISKFRKLNYCIPVSQPPTITMVLVSMNRLVISAVLLYRCKKKAPRILHRILYTYIQCTGNRIEIGWTKRIIRHTAIIRYIENEMEEKRKKWTRGPEKRTGLSRVAKH